MSDKVTLRVLPFGYVLYRNSRYRTADVYANFHHHVEIELVWRFVALSYDNITSTLISIFSHISYISAHLDCPRNAEIKLR